MVEEHGETLQAISDWLIEQGLLQAPVPAMLAGVCRRLEAIGLRLTRANISVRTLHPTIDSISNMWRRDSEVEARPNLFEDLETERWLQSPLRPIVESGDTRIVRADLKDPEVTARWPVFAEFRAEGATEHVAQLVGFGIGGKPTGTTGLIATWVTDRPDGFSDRDIAMLERLIPRLALSVKSTVDHEIAVNLLDTYVGHGAGTEILSGAYRRGSFQIIPAAILFADLRGFSAISDRLARDAMAELLNRCFDAMVAPIEERGGEVLKFLGDGLLAGFDRRAHEDGEVCLGALQAAVAAQEAVAAIAVPDRQRETMQLDVALHMGEVYYGNVGSANRLDFTVLGPAVNEAARIEALCGELGHGLLISESFARATTGCSDRIVGAGRHVLRGTSTRVELFTLRPPA
jgi:adenylate cyclase